MIFPYIGGKEVSNSPTHSFHRYAINFYDRDLEEAETWPDLINIVRERVKIPVRDRQKRKALYERWWQYAEKRPGLYTAISGLDRVIVIPKTSNTQSMTFLASGMIFDQSLIIFPLTTFSAFAALQSQSHQLWSAFFGSSMKDDPVYTPSDCFETFPFPENWEMQAGLESAGKEYYEFRAALMVRNNEGLTKTYNPLP